MSISSRNPQYAEKVVEWMQLRDTYKGERAVKAKRLDYLPASEAMIQDGMTTPASPGWKDYEAYLARAHFHDVVRDAVKAMVGIMHMKPAVIKLPKRLAGMMKQATAQGEGLQMLLRRINEAQLVYGRLGLLADVPSGAAPGEALPYISFYEPERIINWDAGRWDEGQNILDLVVLDESGQQRKGFEWQTENKFRVLTRGGATVLRSPSDERPVEGAPFTVAVKVNDLSMPTDADFIEPQIAGRTMKEIPFVFVGANDLVPEPGESPLLGLSNLSLAIYRGEADYRSTLFYQGQQTLVIIGGNVSDVDEDEQLRVGNKGVIDLRLGGDAKYIGVSAAGLGEMRQSIKADDDKAAQFGVAFMDANGGRGISGEALRIRVAARTTTISTVAQAASAGLEQCLKWCAEWAGEDPEEVSVQVQTDFADQNVAGASLLAFMQAKQLGLPLSLKSLHRMMQLNDMTDMDFNAENTQIEAEAESLIGIMVHGMMDPNATTDETFLDTPPNDDEPPDNGGITPPAKITPTARPGAKNMPVKPYRRGSPVPMKMKVGPKGASAK
jgi:hypothetical protein